MTKEPKLNQRLTTHAAQTVLPGHKKVGRPKGSPKAPGSGRKAGPNRHTVEKEEMMANAIKDVFKSLTGSQDRGCRGRQHGAHRGRTSRD